MFVSTPGLPDIIRKKPTKPRKWVPVNIQAIELQLNFVTIYLAILLCIVITSYNTSCNNYPKFLSTTPPTLQDLPCHLTPPLKEFFTWLFLFHLLCLCLSISVKSFLLQHSSSLFFLFAIYPKGNLHSHHPFSSSIINPSVLLEFSSTWPNLIAQSIQ